MDRDTAWGSATALLFSFTLGVASLLLPVMAVDAGHNLVTVAALYGASSLIQVVLRPLLGVAVRYVSTKTLVQVGSAAQAVSLVVVLTSVSLVALAAAWALQGIARSAFWTGIDTHGARSALGASRALGHLHAWAGIGQLLGPIIAGVVSERSVATTVVIGVVVAMLCAATGAMLHSHDCPARDALKAARRVWGSPGIGSSFSAGFSAGSWRGLMDSVIPVLLREAGQSFSAIGLAISLANGLSIPGSAIVTRLRSTRPLRIAFVLSTLGTGLAVATVAIPMAPPALVYAALSLGGLGSGVLQTLGPVLAAVAVDQSRTGEAIALQGMFRTFSLLSVPALASSLAAVLPVTAALAVVGATIAVTARFGRNIATGGPSGGP